LRLLGSADLIAHEPGVPAAVLDRARADAIRCEIASGAEVPAGSGLIVVIRTA
jgi:uroporphyrin-III C-methyltransferase / precorrin-2 dehydrogenase / sirohydrochlorin ferrochelatase